MPMLHKLGNPEITLRYEKGEKDIQEKGKRKWVNLAGTENRIKRKKLTFDPT